MRRALKEVHRKLKRRKDKWTSKDSRKINSKLSSSATSIRPWPTSRSAQSLAALPARRRPSFALSSGKRTVSQSCGCTQGTPIKRGIGWWISSSMHWITEKRAQYFQLATSNCHSSQGNQWRVQIRISGSVQEAQEITRALLAILPRRHPSQN